jgi:hypothetical protein
MGGSLDGRVDTLVGFRSAGFDDEVFKGLNFGLDAVLSGRLAGEEPEMSSSKGAGRFLDLWAASSSVSTAEDGVTSGRSDFSLDLAAESMLRTLAGGFGGGVVF